MYSPGAAMKRIGARLALSVWLFGSAAHAQDRPSNEDTPPVLVDPQVARTSETGAGRIGERQTREDTAREAGIEPMARLNTRVANRVQNRLRNRIDRHYDPRANATSPFETAVERARRGTFRRSP